MTLNNIIILIAIFAAAIWAYYSGKLTRTGAIIGCLVGLLIYKGAGPVGLAMLAAFFLASSLATKWKIGQKQRIGAAERNKGRRTARQVLANGGIAAVLGLMGWQSPDKSGIILIMIAGTFAAATADTLSSELGMVYGRRFFNILTFKKDTCGLDGVISIEGTLIGLIGAIIIATIYSLGTSWSITFFWITLAGLLGNIIDSVLGAAFERPKFISNNLVNFLNTLAGAMVCWLLMGTI